MLINTVRRFVALSGQYGIKGSSLEIKEHITILRRSGFSSAEISELSGGRWSSTLVRQYTTNWGGVDNVLDTQRKTIIKTLRELVSTNNTINDVEQILRLEKIVNAKGSSLQELAELNIDLSYFELQPNEIGRLVDLSRALLEKNLNTNTVQYWVNLDQELVKNGFTKQVRLYITELCREMGGVMEVIDEMQKFIDLKNIQSLYIQLSNDVEQLSIREEELELKVHKYQEMIKAAEYAEIAGFDAMSLALVSTVSKDLGGPIKVVNAIQEYASIHEIKEDIKVNQIKLDQLAREIQAKDGYLTAMRYTLDETEKVYKDNRNVRQVVNLLVDPRGLKMHRIEVVELLMRVLNCSLTRIDESKNLLEPPDPIWNDIVMSINTLTNRLFQYTKSRT